MSNSIAYHTNLCCVRVTVCVSVCVCLLLPSNQSFYRLIAGYWMGRGDHERNPEGERGSWANKLVT